MRVNSTLTIGFHELGPAEWKKLEKKLTYVNDQGDVVISYRRLVTKGAYKLPRGAWYLLPNHVRYVDSRTRPELPELKFVLTLDDVERDPRFVGQMRAVEQMFREEQGLVIRPPGTGKTEIATAFMAKAQTRSLVLVHTEDILQQWVERIEKNIPELKGQGRCNSGEGMQDRANYSCHGADLVPELPGRRREVVGAMGRVDC
jgi:hypothetical protein